MIKSVSDIAAPRQHVYAVLADVTNFVEWMPSCTGSTITSQTGNVIETQFSASGMKNITMGLRFEMQPYRSITFKMIQSKDVKAYSGAWHLMDSKDGSGTVLRSEMEMDPGAMVPRFMVDRMAKRAVEDTGLALKERLKVVPFEPGDTDAVVEASAQARRVLHVLKIDDGYRVTFLDDTHYISF
jgi:ribosome-associated toxin RatA of RatAB toxin-antitoxin module